MTLATNPPPAAKVVSQAVIVLTMVEDERGCSMKVTSFGSPDLKSMEAEEFSDLLAKLLAKVMEGAKAEEPAK